VLALLADELSGPERRCPGATAGELAGLLQTWAAVESWAGAAKLGLIREMMRSEGVPAPGAGHGDLPESWTPELRHEVSLALACSLQSADTTLLLAWEQRARVPGVAALLENGTLTFAKARAVTEAFRGLSDADAARAEALIGQRLAGKTYAQVLRLAEQAAVTVDPDLATRRRKDAVRRDARVSLFREQAGTAGLSGRDLPPDEALAAMAAVNARAAIYRDSGAFGDARMDLLRGHAYLDLLNGVPAADRIAAAEPWDDRAEAGDDGPEDDGDDDPGLGGPERGGSGPGGSGPGGAGPARSVVQLRPVDLIVPLATLLGLAERPGEVHGFGLLDPDLARHLADSAAASRGTEFCITLTSPEGYATAHGCARPDQATQAARATQAPHLPQPGLPARLNITLPATVLPEHRRHTGPPGPWAFTPLTAYARGSPAPRSNSGPASPSQSPADHGTWTLTIPGGRQFTVRFDAVPLYDCDHQFETRAYQPGDKLRHLVQIRDGTCTFPTCNRHARESDFEHAQPYHRGGRTCACNAGARSRACHQVKQSPGWQVIQPRPGWHQWTTPAGRVYIQEPRRYPA
jgi:hypothetical protein